MKINFGYFYTKGSPYKQVAEQYLLPSLEKQNISNIYCEVTENYGSWNRNVAEKPRTILNILEKLEENDCLVFLDADAEILKYPKLFEEIPENYQIAAHKLSWEQWYGYKGNNTKELLSGTLFLRNTLLVKLLCEKWYENAIQTSEWEQKVLEKIVEESGLNIYELPLEYCYIKSRPGGLDPLVKCDPVILHHQVSRELKRSIK